MDVRMTPAERAAAKLAPPLRFGDPAQIEAVKIIEADAELREFCDNLRKSGEDPDLQCGCCKGNGYTRCPECDYKHDCHACDGSGTIDPEIEAEECTTSQQIRAILLELRGRFPEVA